MYNLDGKIVFITGASSGIGKSCAVQFARVKSKLLLAARRKDRLDSFAAELRDNYGVEVETLGIDVRSYEIVKNKFSELNPSWQQVDILVNNAGLARGLDKFYEGKLEDWNEMIDTNIKGLLNVSRVVAPYMIEKQAGHIINIGSTAGHEVYTYGNVYSATKFAVNALSQSFRLDVLDKGIKISSVDPGMVYTEFSKVRFSGDENRAEQVYKGIVPLYPDDVAEAVIFCATRPANVNINEIILTPLYQASSTQVIRK